MAPMDPIPSAVKLNQMYQKWIRQRMPLVKKLHQSAKTGCYLGATTAAGCYIPPSFAGGRERSASTAVVRGCASRIEHFTPRV